MGSKAMNRFQEYWLKDREKKNSVELMLVLYPFHCSSSQLVHHHSCNMVYLQLEKPLRPRAQLN